MQRDITQMTVAMQRVTKCAVEVLPSPVVPLVAFQSVQRVLAARQTMLTLAPLKLPERTPFAAKSSLFISCIWQIFEQPATSYKAFKRRRCVCTVQVCIILLQTFCQSGNASIALSLVFADGVTKAFELLSPRTLLCPELF